MNDPELQDQSKPPPSGEQSEDRQPKKRHMKRLFLGFAMRYSLLRRGIGIHTVYRDTGGGLIVGGLSYAALFALIPTIVLVVAGVFLLVDDPEVRADAVDLITRAFPAFESVARPAVEGARQLAVGGGIVAIIGFAWGASSLYLNLTRAMERFFPGERVSGALARVLGVLLVVLIILAVLAAVFVAGVITVVAQALEVDTEWLMAVIGGIVTLALATALSYAIYRLIPSEPPTPHGARLPAALAGVAIGLMTLLYGVISPWLVSGYQMFGVMASVFVALLWLRVVFMAIIYGAAMAKYRDHVLLATTLGLADPDIAATEDVLAVEKERTAKARADREALSSKEADGLDDPPKD